MQLIINMISKYSILLMKWNTNTRLFAVAKIQPCHSDISSSITTFKSPPNSICGPDNTMFFVQDKCQLVILSIALESHATPSVLLSVFVCSFDWYAMRIVPHVTVIQEEWKNICSLVCKISPVQGSGRQPVSYTHLTLPTIYSV